jgi:inner membrane protein
MPDSASALFPLHFQYRFGVVEFGRIQGTHMNDVSVLQSSLQGRTSSRSMGLKLIVVSGLALLMTIPALFVSGLVEDRTKRAEDVTREISGLVGGQQTFLGPTLTVPYTIPAQITGATAEHGVYIVFPELAGATVRTRTEERHRSLFKVPVFQADLNFDATFDLAGVPSAVPLGAVLDWTQAEIVVGVSDPRGALADGTLTVNGKTETFIPTENIASISPDSNNNQRLPLTLFGVKATVFGIAPALPPLPAGSTPGGVSPISKFHATAALRFSGAQRIAVLAYGKTTHLTMDGDWPNPSFDGGFLPVKRSVSNQGFSGEWSVPFIARGVRAEGRADSISGLDATALGVSFVELADPYQSVNRSLKYVLLFLGLLFLSYFIFEVTTGKRVHPAQYVLVGVAQIIFYLLLLSFAERIGFDLGFLVAGAATVILLSANAGWIFLSRVQGLRALVSFSLLYALIYLLLRLEDNALLVGAIASFLAVAAVMYFTRNIDWYSSLPSATSQAQAAPSVVPKDDS